MIVGKRKIRDGNKFNYLFPKAKGGVEKVMESAKLSDTIELMKRVVRSTSWQTKKLAEFLKADSFVQTCKNIWGFAYNYFQYEIDTIGIEQIRTPARSWRDRTNGIDCDCFSTLIGATLYQLKIPFFLRLTKYKSNEFEHVYPVAIIGNQQIIMDAVIDEFNHEVPYTEKKDVIMELHNLNGINAQSLLNEIKSENNGFNADLPIDAIDLFGEDLNGLEGKAEREAQKKKRKDKRRKRIEEKGTVKDRIKRGLEKGANKINKINPATVLLRAGVLSAMKLNVFKLASKLRFAYWTSEQARIKNMDLNKFNELQRIREKVEQIFFKAGGDPQKLKKAILSGKGNRNRMVQLNGLGAVVDMPSDEDDLRDVLGDLYHTDFEDESINGLGAIAMGTAITAASGVLATIKRIINKLGGLFKRGTTEAQQEQIQDNTDNEDDKQRRFSVRNLFSKMKTKIQERKKRKEAQRESGEENDDNSTIPEDEFIPNRIDDLSVDEAEFEEEIRSRQPDTESQTENSADEEQAPNEPEEDDEEKGFWSKNWKWIVPVGGALVVGGTALGIHAHKKKKAKHEAEKEIENGVNGLGAVKKGKSKTGTKQNKSKVKAEKNKGNRSRSPKKKATAVDLL